MDFYESSQKGLSVCNCVIEGVGAARRRRRPHSGSRRGADHGDGYNQTFEFAVLDAVRDHLRQDQVHCQTMLFAWPSRAKLATCWLLVDSRPRKRLPSMVVRQSSRKGSWHRG